MTDSYKDWYRDCTVHASDITLDNPAVTQALESGLLMHDHEAAGRRASILAEPVNFSAHSLHEW